jgi:hypothetical protein
VTSCLTRSRHAQAGEYDIATTLLPNVQIGRHLPSILAGLPAILRKRPVYSYVVTTAKLRHSGFVQTGSGPNLLGGAITLCSCKHKDRCSAPKYEGPNASDPWKGIWIAGICSITQHRPNALFYLMLVERTFASQYAAWYSRGAIPNKYAKAAHLSPLGDLYKPNSRHIHNRLDPQDYVASIAGHKHDEKWRKKDIAAQYYGRPHTLLVGDQHQSYAWSRPTQVLKKSFAPAHHRYFRTLSDFVALFP